MPRPIIHDAACRCPRCTPTSPADADRNCAMALAGLAIGGGLAGVLELARHVFPLVNHLLGAA